ncbi:MAG: SAM-dependent methyltransferase [Gammaproteobacteria bacterium]|nr:MAG: SAM-dependent methyltransferase [Gammaproteobacteria bacterium]RKZ95011.1 MAG: SAM-dependent methyltransferase [Gammaproteobacteria bacterium]RKZ96732.1 MAG: SAM-dependent methyltransferase [Gammaproteobacteria bacterium]RLA02621.1 MAG: SAM-dependent methyltransferase [Gammaproteobacteria bacterium]
MKNIQVKWDGIYLQREGEPTPSLVLQQNSYLLPENGIALDLACGQGGNALLLAEAGLDVQAWDISPVAIEQLQEAANLKGLKVSAQVRDVTKYLPTINSVDVLVVSFFLERELCPALFAAIKPGGLLFYQTYCQQKVSQQGPTNPDYLLSDNELLQLFPQMKVRVYREDALLGRHDVGLRNQAILVAQK